MNVDDFIKGENNKIKEENERKEARKKDKKEQAKLDLLIRLGFGEKIYGDYGQLCDQEFPLFDLDTHRPYRVVINVSDEDFARLLEHLKQTNNPHYTKYIKQIKKIEEGEKPLSKPHKIILTVVSIVVFVILVAVVTGIRTDAGFTTSGIFGLILLSILVFVLHSIWKHNNKGGLN